MSRLLTLLTLTLMACTAPAHAPDPRFAGGDASSGDRPAGAACASRSPVLARHGMVAASQPLAAQIGLDVLRAGGSAVDAAIAANVALGLMEPTGCGVGGDLFAIVWDPRARELVGLNASGRSPRGLDLETLRAAVGDRETIPTFGPLSVSVPGCVSGWSALHERFGRVPWGRLFEPTIGYAREGFPVTQVIADLWAMNLERFAANAGDLPDLAGLRATFAPRGRAPREGELFANPDLARTLEAIATGGADAFYRGPLAEAIAAYCEREGCFLRAADLAAHRAEWVRPLSTNYRGVDVYELPPNGQGLAALQMLNLLEAYDLAALGRTSADYLHLSVEAKKLAFADRAASYADPEFHAAPLERLASKAYAAERRALLDPRRAARDDPPGVAVLEEGDTIYLCAADSDGMMVSLIQSNYVGMGSGLLPDGLGFVLQNRGALFALEPGHANVFAPGKRPFHTIIPAFAMRGGEPWLAFGVMGGAMQPQGHVQVLCNRIDFGLDVQAAGDAPRYNHTGSSQPTGTRMVDGGTLTLERGFPAEVRAELERRGHRVEVGGSFGGYQAIEWDPLERVYRGGTEMRKDGQVAGY